MISRVRRGTEDILLKPLVDFLIQLPEVHWKKGIGSSAVGASFGLDFVNRLHLRVGESLGTRIRQDISVHVIQTCISNILKETSTKMYTPF